MSDETLTKLNEKWYPYKTSLEIELNKNSIDFGDIQPGHIYELPIITSIRTNFNGPPQAGFIKDFFIKKENAEVPSLKYTQVLGYTLCSRLALNNMEYFRKNIRAIVEEIKLTIKKQSGITSDDPHYGYYIKLSDFVDKEDSAAYSFIVESNIIPMIQLGYENRELRK